MTKPRLYSAWFCPYAQRVWATLNELGVEYELVEALGSGDEASYTKHPDLSRYNQKGLVPTLVFPDNEKVLCESIDIMKDLYLNHSSQQRDEEVLSTLHSQATRWNQLVCSAFYRVLMKNDTQGREQGWDDMVKGLTAFSERLHWNENDDKSIGFYAYDGNQGDDEDMPSLVDFTVFPFVHRLYIIQYYRGFRLADTAGVSNDVCRKLEAWLAKMEALAPVAKTLANEKDLIRIYKRYADGTANSKVGEAVRQGKEAHNI